MIQKWINNHIHLIGDLMIQFVDNICQIAHFLPYFFTRFFLSFPLTYSSKNVCCMRSFRLNTKSCYIRTDLISTLKRALNSNILTGNKFFVLHFFLLRPINIISYNREPFFLRSYSRDIKHFLMIFISSITNHYMTYNLSVLWYCFCGSSLYTHDCNFKHQKQPNNINDQLSFLWWYNNTLQTSSGLPCCSRE